MDALTQKQLEKNAEEFVNSYRNASDDDISKIIAGMTAIIEGNEASYETMKNQKWFERIWYDLTQKNKATVKEMQARRDQLTKYTVQILIKMNKMMNEHSECIFDLYRALAIARRDLNVVVEEVELLTIRLNEKIISLDGFQDIITDIQNKKYDKYSPLISLIDIMSLLDNRIIQDEAKMVRLKETMENNGFDFSTNVNIQKYSNEVFLLPENKVGRILLFCQSFSNRSRFLAYTNYLIENYFYLSDSDKRIVRESGEAISSALCLANLTSDANCVLDEMFTDLKISIKQSSDMMATVKEDRIKKNYFEYDGVIITGKDKKSIDSLCKRLRLEYSITTHKLDDIFINTNKKSILNKVSEILKNEGTICSLIYCVDSNSARFEQFEIDLVDVIYQKYPKLNIIIAITNSTNRKQADVLSKYICDNCDLFSDRENRIIPILVDDFELDDGTVLKSYGIEDLVKRIGHM